MDIKLKLPILFKRFIGDGFGILEGNKLDFEHWITEIILRETITIDKFKFCNEVDFMDLFINIYIYKGEKFYVSGKLDISVFQKEENKYVYIPTKSGHQIILFAILYWESYVDTLDVLHKNFTFLKQTKNIFFKRLRFRGYKKVFLTRLFRKVKHSSRNDLLKRSPQHNVEGNFILK